MKRVKFGRPHHPLFRRIAFRDGLRLRKDENRLSILSEYGGTMYGGGGYGGKTSPRLLS